ncbi:MAG: branched-chain amino acid ABC transporter permease [Deltaproteobacteria bacterium]|nr:branched-chain amino acid ABC transporter permease [Deltaproteobacteria bacterium]
MEISMEVNKTVIPANIFDRMLDKLCLTPLGFTGLLLLLILPEIPFFRQEYLIRWFIAAALAAGNTIAFDFTAGYINIVNFGYYAFLGLGAYTSALVSINLGITPWIGMFIGALISGLLGFLTGILTLRLRGIFAACLTWFLGLALMGLATKMMWLTRGPLGLKTPKLFESGSNTPYYYTIIAMMFIAYLITRWIVRSKMGLAFRGIGQNMEAARTSGVNPVFYRIVNFTISCVLAGWFGGFYAHYYGIITPDLLQTSKTVEILAIAYIGGRGTLWGGAIAAFPFIYAMESLRSSLSNLPGLNLILYGALLILVMIHFPGGFAGLYKTFQSWQKNQFVRYLMSGKRDI